MGPSDRPARHASLCPANRALAVAGGAQTLHCCCRGRLRSTARHRGCVCSALHSYYLTITNRLCCGHNSDEPSSQVRASRLGDVGDLPQGHTPVGAGARTELRQVAPSPRPSHTSHLHNSAETLQTETCPLRAAGGETGPETTPRGGRRGGPESRLTPKVGLPRAAPGVCGKPVSADHEGGRPSGAQPDGGGQAWACVPHPRHHGLRMH